MEKMAKPRELLRLVLVIMSLAFLLQIPIFFALFKFSNLSPCSTFILALDRSTNVSQNSQYSTINETSVAQSVQLSQDRLVLEEMPKKVISLTPHSYPHYPFVHFNTYRISLNAFFVVGLTSVVARNYDRPVYKCEWHPSNGTSPVNPQTNTTLFKITDAEMIYVGFDENGKTYVPAIVNCTFPEMVGEDGEGGLLRLWVSVGPNRGDRTATVNAFEEKFGEIEKIRWVEEEPPRFKYAFCGPPMHSTIRAEWVHKWLVYHTYLWEGSVHFFFYNVGGVTEEARSLMEPFEKAGLLTIIDVLDEKEYPSWYYNQLLFINDCLHRSRFIAQWTFYHDLDEFLWVPEPNTLSGLLEENKDAPWMTFGNLPASMGHCRPEKSPDEWHLQRMIWRDKQPECMHQEKNPWLCFEAPGRRKYMVNPRKVFATGVHRVAIPATGGVDFNASVSRVHHFHGVLNPKVNICGQQVNTSLTFDELNWLLHGYLKTHEQDESISIAIGKARLFAASLLQP